MSKILNHNTSFLKVELDNGSVLFLSKEDMEVYAESDTIYLKSPFGLNTFPFASLLDPTHPTLPESVKTIQGYLDQHINSINEEEVIFVPEADLTFTELALNKMLIQNNEIIRELKKQNLHFTLITGNGFTDKDIKNE